MIRKKAKVKNNVRKNKSLVRIRVMDKGNGSECCSQGQDHGGRIRTDCRGTVLMKKAVVLETEDIRKIIADHFGVNEKAVIKAQYTYTVITNDDEKEKSGE